MKVHLVKNVYEISIYLLTAHFPTLTKTLTILQFGLRISQEITDESSSLEINLTKHKTSIVFVRYFFHHNTLRRDQHSFKSERLDLCSCSNSETHLTQEASGAKTNREPDSMEGVPQITENFSKPVLKSV